MNILRRYPETPLYDACNNNQTAVVRALIPIYPNDINTNSREGYPPIYYATRNGNLEMIQMLVDAGANIHFRDAEGWTLFHECCYHGHTDCVRYLLANGVDHNLRDCNGETPLDHARKCIACTEIVKMLETHNAHPEIKEPE